MQRPNINAPGTVKIESLKTSCDGGGGALGHPKIYLTINLDKGNSVDCPYCDKRFVLKEGVKITGHH